ncbi:GGDEF domain-containing protein [Allohahella sp. A8]|uniref:sensor domain-containing diguanylate cyclase n=1 Tax=Allohahella sp. A8 TaxID=3141461 RepID=UPI003A8082C7
MIIFLRWLLAPLLLCAASMAYSANAISLEEGWEYRWGDSPFTQAGEPEWAISSSPDDWQAIGFPSNPPGRDGHTNVWFRVPIPEAHLHEPVLYIFSVDLIVQVFHEGRQIYQYGTFDAQGQGRFEGWPWHIVKLPTERRDNMLYFRVFSDYTDIGLWGEVKLMERSDLQLFILKNSAERIVVSGFTLTIGLLSLVFALFQANRRHFGTLALFSLASGAMILAESQASQLLWDQPLFWVYLRAFSYYLLPVPVALLLELWLAKRRFSLAGWIWRIHLLYAIAAPGLAYVGVFSLASTFPVFDALFLSSMLLMFAAILLRARRISVEQGIMLTTCVLYLSLLLADMAVAHGILSWTRVPVAWGSLAFSTAVVVLSLWSYSRTQRILKKMNSLLERKVAERTHRLKQLADQERQRVQVMSFNNEKSLLLNDVISEMQGCEDFHSAITVLGTRMPKLCSPLHGAAYFRPDESRRFIRMNTWGDAEQDALPDAITDEEEFEAGSHWCFRLTIQHTKYGNMKVGLLFLQTPTEGTPGSTQLYQSIERAVDKAAVTLTSLSLRDELKRFSYEDSLTGLKNRRFFDELFVHETAVALRSRAPLTIIMGDLDYFKRFNDAHGHEAGDTALQAAADALRAHFRDTDIICRFGGEEFVILMPDTDSGHAWQCAQRLLETLRKHVVVYRGKKLGVTTISLGIASWPEQAAHPQELLCLADKALYNAKQSGRDRVAIA